MDKSESLSMIEEYWPMLMVFTAGGVTIAMTKSNQNTRGIMPAMVALLVGGLVMLTCPEQMFTFAGSSFTKLAHPAQRQMIWLTQLTSISILTMMKVCRIGDRFALTSPKVRAMTHTLVIATCSTYIPFLLLKAETLSAVLGVEPAAAYVEASVWMLVMAFALNSTMREGIRGHINLVMSMARHGVTDLDPGLMAFAMVCLGLGAMDLGAPSMPVGGDQDAATMLFAALRMHAAAMMTSGVWIGAMALTRDRLCVFQLNKWCWMIGLLSFVLKSVHLVEARERAAVGLEPLSSTYVDVAKLVALMGVASMNEQSMKRKDQEDSNLISGGVSTEKMEIKKSRLIMGRTKAA